MRLGAPVFVETDEPQELANLIGLGLSFDLLSIDQFGDPEVGGDRLQAL